MVVQTLKSNAIGIPVIESIKPWSPTMSASELSEKMKLLFWKIQYSPKLSESIKSILCGRLAQDVESSISNTENLLSELEKEIVVKKAAFEIGQEVTFNNTKYVIEDIFPNGLYALLNKKIPCRVMVVKHEID